MMRFALQVTLIVLALAQVQASAAIAEGPPEKFNPPKRYYLALGDSIAYGMQMHKIHPDVPASAFNTGYVDVFASRLRSIRSGVEMVNYSCPGETTTTFVIGGCPWTSSGGPLHSPYEGSQLDAALSFLRAHRGQVSPITLHLFGNDVAEFVASCGNDFACIQLNASAAITAYAERLHAILSKIRREAPEAEIIVTSGWNPRVDFIPESDPLFQGLINAMRVVVGSERARLVDLSLIFNPNPVSARLAALCTLTLTCTTGDSHPSDPGYVTIADAVWAASGYEKFRAKH